MEIGEQLLGGPHLLEFSYQWLFHLQHQAGLLPDHCHMRGAGRPRPLVGGVRDGALPSPAPAWTTTSSPAVRKAVIPEGVSDTRFSSGLTSVGTPTRIAAVWRSTQLPPSPFCIF